MVQINDLIVVEVPKDATDFEIVDKESLPVALFVHVPTKIGSMTINTPYPVSLPPGNYEIIGVYSKLHTLDVMDIFIAADFESATTNLSTGILTLLSAHCINPNKETDLLFIKKIK